MRRSSYLLLFFSSLIFIIGILMVFNITSAEIIDKSSSIHTHNPFLKQILYCILGMSLGVFIYKTGYENIIRLSPLLIFLTFILLILVFVPKVGIIKNGAKRWVGINGFSFQPSEFFKYLIPIYAIYYFSKNNKKSLISFIKFLFIIIFPIFLVLIEPDNGTVAIIFASLIVFFFLSRVKFLYWALPLSLIIITGSIIAYNMPHVKNRIFVYLHPETDIQGKGHQPYQAKIATGSGRLLGKGLGESLQKLNYLPQARSDYIAAIYAEEFGFLGIVILITLYLILTYLGFFIAAKAKERNGFYISSMMTFLISFQTFLNLGVVSGVLPSKGIALPFFSQGGTSLIVNILAISIILSVNKKTNIAIVRDD